MEGGNLILERDFQRGLFPTKRQQLEKQMIQVLEHLLSKTGVLRQGRLCS